MIHVSIHVSLFYCQMLNKGPSKASHLQLFHPIHEKKAGLTLILILDIPMLYSNSKN